nr:MAG TPA: hypothetical protein [Caudoviricetes sp.]
MTQRKIAFVVFKGYTYSIILKRGLCPSSFFSLYGKTIPYDRFLPSRPYGR